jgi:2-polyprenyl-3-methyl-5-hydroxy-6-metoxy-1,4-benzoquinol methylase
MNLKLFMKKIIKKIPGVHRLLRLFMVAEKVDLLQFEFIELSKEISLIEQTLDQLNHKKEVSQEIDRISDLKKLIIRTKWDIINQVEILEKRALLCCSICDYESESSNFKIIDAMDRLIGGKIRRYQCPKCGVIFGPLDFMAMTAEELSAEYSQLYEVYAEGDSTDKEIETFMSLNPKKEKRYLNFGCGVWSKSIEILRSQGWDVWGFDANIIKNADHLVSDISRLKSMKFDGIFTNNLIEHLQDPVNDFLMHKSLISTKDALIAHSTPCYEYSYEYTRFHLHFFTGNSIAVICHKTGLKVQSIKEKPEIDYINYIFSIDGE